MSYPSYSLRRVVFWIWRWELDWRDGRPRETGLGLGPAAARWAARSRMRARKSGEARAAAIATGQTSRTPTWASADAAGEGVRTPDC